MSVIRFLFDECVNANVIDCLTGLEPSIDWLQVGQAGAPAKGTLDPEVLLFAELNGRMLVSGDRSTMIVHLQDHFLAGGHTAGVIFLRGGFSIGEYGSSLHLIWFASDGEEWFDQTAYVPF